MMQRFKQLRDRVTNPRKNEEPAKKDLNGELVANKNVNGNSKSAPPKPQRSSRTDRQPSNKVSESRGGKDEGETAKTRKNLTKYNRKDDNAKDTKLQINGNTTRDGSTYNGANDGENTKRENKQEKDALKDSTENDKPRNDKMTHQNGKAEPENGRKVEPENGKIIPPKFSYKEALLSGMRSTQAPIAPSAVSKPLQSPPPTPTERPTSPAGSLPGSRPQSGRSNQRQATNVVVKHTSAMPQRNRARQGTQVNGDQNGKGTDHKIQKPTNDNRRKTNGIRNQQNEKVDIVPKATDKETNQSASQSAARQDNESKDVRNNARKVVSPIIECGITVNEELVSQTAQKQEFCSPLSKEGKHKEVTTCDKESNSNIEIETSKKENENRPTMPLSTIKDLLAKINSEIASVKDRNCAESGVKDDIPITTRENAKMSTSKNEPAKSVGFSDKNVTHTLHEYGSHKAKMDRLSKYHSKSRQEDCKTKYSLLTPIQAKPKGREWEEPLETLDFNEQPVDQKPKVNKPKPEVSTPKEELTNDDTEEDFDDSSMPDFSSLSDKPNDYYFEFCEEEEESEEESETGSAESETENTEPETKIKEAQIHESVQNIERNIVPQSVAKAQSSLSMNKDMMIKEQDTNDDILKAVSGTDSVLTEFQAKMASLRCEMNNLRKTKVLRKVIDLNGASKPSVSSEAATNVATLQNTEKQNSNITDDLPLTISKDNNGDFIKKEVTDPVACKIEYNAQKEINIDSLDTTDSETCENDSSFRSVSPESNTMSRHYKFDSDLESDDENFLVRKDHPRHKLNLDQIEKRLDLVYGLQDKMQNMQGHMRMLQDNMTQTNRLIIDMMENTMEEFSEACKT